MQGQNTVGLPLLLDTGKVKVKGARKYKPKRKTTNVYISQTNKPRILFTSQDPAGGAKAGGIELVNVQRDLRMLF